MRFTIELAPDDLRTFRFCTDGTFRRIPRGILELREQDQTYDTPEAAYGAISQLRSPLPLAGQQVWAILVDGEWYIDKNTVEFCVSVHRDSAPPSAPTFEAVRSAIGFGRYDQIPSALAIQLDGCLEILPFSQLIGGKPSWACHAPVFWDEHDVGPEAAQADHHVRQCLENLLEGWRTHLATGTLGLFSDGLL